MATIIDGIEYVGYTQVAAAITVRFPSRPRRNGQPYTRQQVHVWYMRKDRNGFPERFEVVNANGIKKKLFKLQEVLEWFEAYDPTGQRKAANVDN